jgi:DNA recombination protein RmuC
MSAVPVDGALLAALAAAAVLALSVILLLRLQEQLRRELRAVRDDNGQALSALADGLLKRVAEHGAVQQQQLDSVRSVLADRLEGVQRGLGEMQALAAGVGDLKKVLVNVKARGTWGEVQLGALLEQFLCTGQYARDVATRPGHGERVEYAIRLPGRSASEPVWLPIDAKFPQEDYLRLVDAQEAGDVDAAARAGKGLETRVRREARAIREKYLAPPHTTDFAVLFVPTESLFAEIARRPALIETLQLEERITVAGPTTIAALLSSLQLGFRTLAIEQRSAELGQLLLSLRSEFERFSEGLERTRRKLADAAASLEQTDARSRKLQGTLEALQAPD